MNKVESIIKEELGQTLVDLAVKEIKAWAKKELNYLRYALDYPVFVQLNSNTLVVGKFNVITKNEYNHIVKQENKIIHNFYSKKAAILFCTLDRLNYDKISRDLLERDKKVAKFHDELEMYTAKLKQKKSTENFKRDLWISRYLESKAQFRVALTELKKTIRNAKYMKIWDKIL
jgi:hypothetical protein